MLTLLYVVLGAVVVVAAGFVLRRSIGSYLVFRGRRVITCPENQRPAAVDVDARRAAVTSAFGERKLQLRDCSRWPEKEGCGQECLSQIEAAPADCLVRSLVASWCAGASCVLCGKSLGEVDWLTRAPALLAPDRRTVAWSEVPAETLPEVLATHHPVCWDCHVIESVVRDHPDRVVVRPDHRSPGVPGPMPAEPNS
jgi:hypothetical protein